MPFKKDLLSHSLTLRHLVYKSFFVDQRQYINCPTTMHAVDIAVVGKFAFWRLVNSFCFLSRRQWTSSVISLRVVGWLFDNLFHCRFLPLVATRTTRNRHLVHACLQLANRHILGVLLLILYCCNRTHWSTITNLGRLDFVWPFGPFFIWYYLMNIKHLVADVVKLPLPASLPTDTLGTC